MACSSTATTLRKYRGTLQGNAPGEGVGMPILQWKARGTPSKLLVWAAAVASPYSATDSQVPVVPLSPAQVSQVAGTLQLLDW